MKPKTANTIYTLEVFIIGGPVTEKFTKKNPVISRTIQICGNQTLEDLHEAIFDAFDRHDSHMYQFEFNGSGPSDPNADKYVLPMEMESLFGDNHPAPALRLREILKNWCQSRDLQKSAMKHLRVFPSSKRTRLLLISAMLPIGYFLNNRPFCITFSQ